MNIFVYSDESGVLDKTHNKVFVFGGLVFLSKDEKDIASRKYIHAENTVRHSGNYDKAIEIKAASVSPKEKGKLYRSLNAFYKFGVIVDQPRVLDSIMADKKSKQRFLDYALKIGIKKLLQKLISQNIINPQEVDNMYVFVDEHSTSTNGLYELRESLEEEFKRGMYTRNFTYLFPPLFPNANTIDLRFCNSSTTTLVRAADIIANRIYHKALNGEEFADFDLETNRLFITHVPK